MVDELRDGCALSIDNALFRCPCTDHLAGHNQTTSLLFAVGTYCQDRYTCAKWHAEGNFGCTGGKFSRLRRCAMQKCERRNCAGCCHTNSTIIILGWKPPLQAAAFVVTLTVDPATVLKNDAVNFVVLTENGMKKFLAGVDPIAVKKAMGSPMLFDQVGNRLTALVPGDVNADYTVVVFNNGRLPASYMLHVLGGELVDDAGQSLSALQVGAPIVESPTVAQAQKSTSDTQAVTLSEYEGIVKRLGIAAPIEAVSILRQLRPEPVRSLQMSGALMNSQERHYLNLATDMGGGDITLTLHYESKGGAPTHLNFWVMTQDGVRHLIQGGLAQELNLATGLPVAGKPGVYQARLRMAQNMLYTVVVFSEGVVEADYTLAVQGGILVDRYGQTREAHASEMEVLALADK